MCGEGWHLNEVRKSRRSSIGLVAINALALFDEKVAEPIGGMETRCAILARGMVSRGWSVSVFVRSAGKQRKANFDGVTLRRYDPFWLQMELDMRGRFKKRWWFPIINGTWDELNLIWRVPLYLLYRPFPRFFGSKFWAEWQGMSAVLCFGNSSVSAQTIADCERYGIPSLLMIASDSDLDESYTKSATGSNPYGAMHSACWYAITHATRVVVQTKLQQDLLSERFRRESVLMRNPVPTLPNAASFERTNSDMVLWIGRADPLHKRPMLCIELARLLPDIKFVMIVNSPHRRQFLDIERVAPANVQMIERVDPSRVWELMARARLLVNTSSLEGFPNVFLQAAVAHVPVVSLEVDPDGLFSKIGGGFCAQGDFNQFVDIVRSVWTDASLGATASARLAEYVHVKHSLKSSLDVLEELVASDQFQRVRMDGNV